MFLIVTRSFPPEIGGMQILIGGLANSLNNYDRVKVFADEYENSREYDIKTNLDISRVKGFKIIRKFRKAKMVNDFIKKNKIKAFFADHWKSFEYININNLNETKKFLLVHSKEINFSSNSSQGQRISKSFKKSDFIIANSNFTKRLAQNHTDKKVLVINPGVDKPKEISNIFDNKAKEIFGDSFPKLITVARYDKRKGHDKVIMSIKNLKIKYPNIKYICVGYGDEEPKLKSLVKELNLEKNVLFYKNIENNLKMSLIKNSNVFIMPSIKYGKSVEGFGISFIEAAIYGVPSIGGNIGGANDAILNNNTGIICDGNSLNSVQESIENIFADNKYIDFGRAAKIFSEQFFWENIIKKYLKLIN